MLLQLLWLTSNINYLKPWGMESGARWTFQSQPVCMFTSDLLYNWTDYQTPGKLHVEMFLGPPDSLLEQPETVPNSGKKLLANFCNRYFFHFVLILLDTRPTNPPMMHFYWSIHHSIHHEVYTTAGAIRCRLDKYSRNELTAGIQTKRLCACQWGTTLDCFCRFNTCFEWSLSQVYV